MQSRLASVILLTVGSLTLGGPVASAEQGQEQPKNKKAPSTRQQQASLTGCVDQQDGRYVLISDRTRALIANLEAEGFPTEGFAKHLGNKVTVRGTTSPGGTEHPVFKVRSIEAVSDGCGPQEH